MLKYMRYSFAIMVSVLLSSNAYCRDAITDEVALLETPVVLYDELTKIIPTPLSFTNQTEFENLASRLKISSELLQQKLYMMTRLSMNHHVKKQSTNNDTTTLIAKLELLTNTPYEKAFVELLKGRYHGRVNHNYDVAIPHYNQALVLVQELHDLKSLLLKHTIHRHLGMLYMLTRQKKPAFTHFTAYRETAYQLRNSYLITFAEAELGKYYNKTGQLDLALEHFSEAIRLSQNNDYPKQKAHLQLRLSRIYRDLGRWDDAIRYAQLAADNFRILDSGAYVSNALTVIAMVHTETEQWNQAIDYYLNAQQIDANLGNITAQALTFHNLGEVYSKKGDLTSALDYLLKANAIFKDRQIKHYLVSNELLIAEVEQLQKNWPMVKRHAELALGLAKEKSLVDEQIQALTYQAAALTALDELRAAIAALEAINSLKSPVSLSETNQSVSPIRLAKQKLTAKVSELKQQLVLSQQQQHNRNTILLLTMVMLIALVIALYHFASRSQKLTRKIMQLSQDNQREPSSNLLGQRAFMSQLDKTHKKQTLALIQISSLTHADIIYGQQAYQKLTQQLQSLLSEIAGVECFIIRAGVFALSYDINVSPESAFKTIQSTLKLLLPESSFALGVINLPLFDNSDVNIKAPQLLEAVQHALAGAMSLCSNANTETSYYTALRAVDFAPSSVFSSPACVHLTHAIQRGFIKVDSNGEKDAIEWPSEPWATKK